MNLLPSGIKSLFKRSTSDEPTGDGVSLYGANNIFGSLGRRRIPRPVQKGFIPDGFNGETIDLTGSEGHAVWLGLDNTLAQAQAYDLCSPLAAVIDRIAQAGTNGRIQFVDDDDDVIKNVNYNPALKRVKTLLLDPNPLQTWSEFNNEQDILSRKHGYCPVFAIGPSGMDKTYAKALVNLDPVYCTPAYNNDYDIFSTNPKNWNPIKEWYVTIFGKTYTIPSEDIMIVKDGLGNKVQINNMGLPKSKIEGLDYFISNICAAMEADNVLLKKKGPLGVFSHDPKSDIAGWQPLDREDKRDLQRDLGRYGLSWGQLQYVISKTPIKWNPMSFNVRDLMTKETIRMGCDGICDRFDYPAELMSGKNATYENRSSAGKWLYENNVIPYSLRKAERINKFFGIRGFRLSYIHLPVLQEDILHAGQARESMSNSLLVDWEAGLISWNEYRTLQDLEPVEGKDDYYYKDYIKENPELNKNKKPEAPEKKKVKNGSTPKNTGTKE